MSPRRRIRKIITWLQIVGYQFSAGRIGGRDGGAPVVLLTTVGRVSGRRRTVRLIGIPDGERLVVIASARGAQRHPGWYHNLATNPDVVVQWAARRRAMRARTALPPERDELWTAAVARYPFYADFQRRTEREIPVVVCEPAG
jgi:F420H(2)-dependent quinone reductase